jgi:CRISPR-associated protein Csx16
MTTHLITRHPGALEWALRQGLGQVAHCAHLDPADIAPGDVVIGTLPVHLAAEVCACGGRYFNLSLDLPESKRGRELTADELEVFGVRLGEYVIQKLVDMPYKY